MNGLSERFRAAQDLARSAGALAFDYYRRRDRLASAAKGIQDFVSEADRAVEEHIRTRLADRFPEDGFFGEETGAGAGSGGLWVVDPIDGTSNFLRGIDHWAVSIAYVEAGRAMLGVIHDPVSGSLYAARRGAGATRDDAPIAVSRVAEAARAVIGIGVSRRRPFGAYLDTLAYLHETGVEHRRFGSAALGLAHMAEGRTDGYFEAHLNSWDALSGLLLVEEAGGWCHAFPAFGDRPGDAAGLAEGGPVLAAAPALRPVLEPLLRIGTGP